MTPICHRLLIEAPATAWRAAQVACRVVGALALATGILGLGTHLAFTAFERRMLRWHPSQRSTEL